MNIGEMTQKVRLHERTILIHEEQIKALEKAVYEMKELLKSPIRREIHVTRQKQQQESGV